MGDEGVYRWSDDGSIEPYLRWNHGNPNTGSTYNCGKGDTHSYDPQLSVLGYSMWVCSEAVPVLCKITHLNDL